MNFTEETNKALEKVISEQLPQLIEQKSSKMIESIVDDIFRWGNVKDSIKKKIEESINVNLQRFDLIDYNALIAKTINENLLNQVNLQPILDMTQDILGFVNKKEIKLDEVADLFIKAAMQEDEQEHEGEITFLVEKSAKYDWITIHADINPDVPDYKCHIKFIISNDGDDRDGKIFSFKTKDEYYDQKQKETSPSRLTSYRGIEAEIFRLYSGQVKITEYTDGVETYWRRYD